MFESFIADASMVTSNIYQMESRREDPPKCEMGKWHAYAQRDIYPSGDIDEYRAKYGKENGELRFFDEYKPQPGGSIVRRGNLLLCGGPAIIWQMITGTQGTGTSNNAYTWFNQSNATIGIGDSSTTEVFNQYDLQASSNKIYQPIDSTSLSITDVSLPSQSTIFSVTGVTNGPPAEITTGSSHGYTTNDLVYIVGVGGVSGINQTIWQITVTSSTKFTLNNSSASGTYTSGGYATKSNIMKLAATLGPTQANFAWNEWCVANGTNTSVHRVINRKVTSLGTKTTGNWSLTIGIGIQ